MGRCPVPVVNAIIGAALGFLSGLGVGGGSLLLLWLTLVSGMEQSEARLINLMFFLPCAIVATAFRWKHTKPDWPLTLWTAASALLGAYLGNVLGGLLNMGLLKKLLGALFILSGLRELRMWKKTGTDA